MEAGIFADSPVTIFRFVMKYTQALDALGWQNFVRLFWALAHEGIASNMTADTLANRGAEVQYIGPVPAMYIHLTTAQTLI